MATLFETLLNDARSEPAGAAPGSRTLSLCSAQNIIFFFFFCARSETIKVKLSTFLGAEGRSRPRRTHCCPPGRNNRCGREREGPGSAFSFTPPPHRQWPPSPHPRLPFPQRKAVSQTRRWQGRSDNDQPNSERPLCQENSSWVSRLQRGLPSPPSSANDPVSIFITHSCS